jgi:glycerophosphoryl diester phosphodiesterase
MTPVARASRRAIGPGYVREAAGLWAVPMLNRRRTLIVPLAVILLFAISSYSASAAPAAQATPATPADYAPLFGVGHNSGRSLAANAQALLHGADIVEIDVRSLSGQLVSSHFPILTVGEWSLFQGPTVEQVWAASANADAIQLDLKETSDAFVHLLIAFLQEHKGEHHVMVASPDIATLARLASTSRDVVPFLSVHNRATLAGLLADTPGCHMVRGVSIREELLDAGSISQLHAAGLLIFAWTVNDPSRADELVQMGVDGITTDDLVLLERLGGAQRGERRLISDETPSGCAA